MKRWERGLLVLVAGWVLLDAMLKVGALLAGGMALANLDRPFRVHRSDVQNWNLANEPQMIRCPECGGLPKLQGYDKWTGRGVFCALCGAVGLADVRSLPRPVVIVGDDEPTDYPVSR